jgi:hypothetical protein
MHHHLVHAGALPSLTRGLALVAAVTLAIVLLGAPSGAAAVSTGACTNLAVGPPEEVVSDAERDADDLQGWPDGPLGILPRGDGTYDFYGMDAFGGSLRPQRLTTSHGTLAHPLAGGISSRTQVMGLSQTTYQWVGGAPVYRDPATGMILQVLHVERDHSSGSGFYSELALARLNPATGVSTYLGMVVAPELSYQASNAHHWTADIGMPSFVIVDHGGEPWFHFYFADFREAAPGVFAADGLSVAGAPVSQVLAAAARGTVSPWYKLYDGSWSQPGLGGRSDDLQPGQSQAWAPRVARSSELGAYVMAAATGPHEVVLSTSVDGTTNWSPRVPLFVDPGYYDAYVNLVGAGPDPSDLGHDFYLYYTQWLSKEPNWEKAHLVRRLIHCAAPPAPPAPPDQPTPVPPSSTPPRKHQPQKPRIRAVKLSKATMTWHHHRLGLAVRGRVVPPKGVTRCHGGKVALQLSLGHAKHPALRLSPRVGKHCQFRAGKRRRLHRAPRKGTLAVQFLGNAQLRRGPVEREHLRVRRER